MIRKTHGNKSLLNGASLSGWEKVNRFSPDKNEAAAGLHISVTTSASVTKNKQTISHHHSARCLNNQSLKFTNILTWTKQHPRTPPTHAWDIYSCAQCHISPKLHWQCCSQLSLESAHLAIPNYQNRWTSWQIQKIFGPSVWYMCLNRVSIKCASNDSILQQSPTYQQSSLPCPRACRADSDIRCCPAVFGTELGCVRMVSSQINPSLGLKFG